jgi:FkbM family methyltransferase|tara:strand:- start:122 stop:877 length:756 start_codon:yes stop_codon:yes gene_type:complete
VEQYYRTIAETHFSEEPNIKIREELAEQFLIRKYLGDSVGYFVEVGANDPFSLSQTWHLAQVGWSGILVEPIPELCKELRSKRPEAYVVEAACGAPQSPTTALFTVASDSGKSSLATEFLDKRTIVESRITVDILTLDEILQQQNTTTLDFVSIDVEGTQLEVLKGFTLQKWKPRLLVIEDHLLDTRSHKKIIKQGYKLVKRTLFNNWYVPDGVEPPETGAQEDKILSGKFRRIPIRRLRYQLRKMLGRGI